MTHDSITSEEALVPETHDSFSSRYGKHTLLGKGGMGEVYLVQDQRVGRDVALKIIRPHRSDLDEDRRRFLREARVQGRLEHPSVVPVHDLGLSPQGQPYFAMKRIRGHTLREIVDDLASGNEEAARNYPRHKLLAALAQACLALDFAHQHGIVHRDIKPSNIMLGDFGEIYLLDWGIAKVKGASDIANAGGLAADALDGEAEPDEAIEDTPEEETATGTVLGSRGYASPEQIRGLHSTLDGRADLYSMGVILFEVITLQPLHAKELSTLGTMMATIKGVDARPSLRIANVAPELDEICARATATEPDDRYASARDLAAALERFLAGERDNETRARLADVHETNAAAAAKRVLAGGPDIAEDRRMALREVGSALALRPESPDALQTLMDLMTHPPDQIPAEVKREIAAQDEVSVGSAFRSGRIAYACWLCIFPLLLWMGVRDWPVFGLTLAGTVGIIVVCFLGMRTTRNGVYSYLLVLLIATVLGLASQLLGPLFVVPAILASNTLSFSMYPVPKHRIAYTAILLLALIVPLGLQLAGILPPSYLFEGERLVVISRGVAFPELPSLVMLVVVTLAAVLVPVFWADEFRNQLKAAEARVVMQSWQLRQLFPGDEASKEATPPTADG